MNLNASVFTVSIQPHVRAKGFILDIRSVGDRYNVLNRSVGTIDEAVTIITEQATKMAREQYGEGVEVSPDEG